MEFEKRHANEQLEKIRLLLKYFHEKMSEHNLPIDDKPTPELISPLYHPITPLEEQTILSSYMNEKDSSPIAIAMKLPKNFLSLDINSTTNEIIHSPYHSKTPIEYKKELPTDILDKYAGVNNRKQQQSNQGKKNKKNKKVKLF